MYQLDQKVSNRNKPFTVAKRINRALSSGSRMFISQGKEYVPSRSSLLAKQEEFKRLREHITKLTNERYMCIRKRNQKRASLHKTHCTNQAFVAYDIAHLNIKQKKLRVLILEAKARLQMLVNDAKKYYTLHEKRIDTQKQMS